MKENILIRGLDFSWDEILLAREQGTLLSFDLELSKACNLRCIYCYGESGRKQEGEMALKEIFSVVEQAADLGAQKAIIIGGGEPLVYRDYWKVVKKFRSVGLPSITFTSGTLITEDKAKRLFDLGEDIALKLNSFQDDIQDYLAGGIPGSGKKIKKALRLLLEAGYSSTPECPRLALESIICRHNLHEMIDWYKFCRTRNITPYLEILTLQGRAKGHGRELEISVDEGYSLFKRLKEYDEREWGITWPLTPPIVGQNCKRMYYSVYITATGDVQPCPGVDISSGNIRDRSLRNILRNSEVFQKVRNIDRYIKEPCKSCRFAAEEGCYGCRGTALHHTGDYLNADPTCWWLPKSWEQRL